MEKIKWFHYPVFIDMYKSTTKFKLPPNYSAHLELVFITILSSTCSIKGRGYKYKLMSLWVSATPTLLLVLQCNPEIPNL